MTALTVSIHRGTAGDDNLTGSGNDDDFLLWQGGNDIFHMGAALNAGDRLDGGTGKDAVILNGDYSAGVTLDADTITNVEVIALVAGHSYKLTTNDGNVAAGEMLLVRGGTLASGNTLTFDGSAELDGKFYVIGGAGNDTLTGGARHDVFDLSKGGNDTAHGGGGNDTFNMGAALTSADVIDGGAGNDTLELNGNYSGGGYTFANGQLTSIDTLKLDTGHIYVLSWNDSDLASGQTLVVDGSAMTGGSLYFNGSAEQDGTFHVIAGASQVGFQGGAGNDYVDLTHATSGLSLGGQGGDDTFLFSNNYDDISFQSVDGGSGNDTVEFDGDYGSVTIGIGDVFNVETIRFDGGHTYGNVFIAEQVPSLTIDASQVSTLFQLTYTNSNYTIEVGSGGMDATPYNGASYNDTFIVTSEAALSASVLDAGGGTDTLVLNGDFSLGMTLGSSTIANFEAITLEDGNSYSFALLNSVAATGTTFTIDAGALTGSNTLSFDGHSETDAHYAFIAGAGADIIDGGQLSDTFDLTHSDGAFVVGAGGDDSFMVTTRAHLLDDSIDGSTGTDTLILNGDFSTQTALTFANLSSVETLQLLGTANSYNLTWADAITTALTVDASAAGQLTFSGAGDTTTAFTITGSAGNDIISGGGKADIITGGLGADALTGNGGGDLFVYNSVTDSNTNALDSITDFTAGSDKFELNASMFYNGEFNTAVALGSLDADLASAFASNGGGVHSGFVFDFTGADFNGQSFLVLDSNGNGAYDGGIDLVIEITGHVGTITSGDFI